MIKRIQDANAKKRTIILRLDLNIPFSNGKSADLSRIKKAIKLLRFRETKIRTLEIPTSSSLEA